MGLNVFNGVLDCDQHTSPVTSAAEANVQKWLAARAPKAPVQAPQKRQIASLDGHAGTSHVFLPEVSIGGPSLPALAEARMAAYFAAQARQVLDSEV